MRKSRKHYTGPEKMAILRRHLLDRVPVSERCEAHQLQPSRFYHWQKKLFENGAVAFEVGRSKPAKAQAAEARRIAALEAKLRTKNDVLAERMEEYVALKKRLGSPEGGLGSPRHARRDRRLREPLVAADRSAGQAVRRLAGSRREQVR